MEDQQQSKVKGLKRLTKANSIPMRVAKGGKDLVRDTSKTRKYKVAGESK
jgi:hypothetical protein